ncbi:MAG: integration host factor subunit beta [Deltaproteobacteria bacterium]|nr:integration host factor subunit beta [Deltaproteobacteria bacterium]
MNKSDLIQILSETNNIPYRKAELLVESFFDFIIQSLKVGKRIEIRGFGSFFTKSYKSYMGRNPNTGEKIVVAPKKLPVFRAGRELKKKINEKSTSE